MPLDPSEIANEPVSQRAISPSLIRVAQGAARRVLLFLVHPPEILTSSSLYFKTPLGLYRLRKGIEEADATIECRILPYTFGGGAEETARLLDLCRDYQPGVVGISALSFGMKYALIAAAAIKSEFPLTPIILGGPHATSFPLGIAQHTDFDYYVCGEGARSGADLIRALFDGAPELTTIHGIVYRGATTLVQTPPRPFSKSLDWLPSLNWMEIDIGDSLATREVVHNAQLSYLFRRPTIFLPVFASRGCPFKCSFCENIQHGPFQYFSVERVMAEIRSGVERFSGTDLHLGFYDNLIHFNRPWFRELLTRIKEEFNLPVTVGGRADLLDFELIDFMDAHNVAAFHVFPESGTKRIRQEMKKDYDEELFMRNVRYFAQKDTFLFGSFIVGWPGETLLERRETQALVAEPFFDACFINSLVYLANSPIGSTLEPFGILPDTPEYFEYLENGTLDRPLTHYSAADAQAMEQDEWRIIENKIKNIPARKLERMKLEGFVFTPPDFSVPDDAEPNPSTVEAVVVAAEPPRLPGILKLLARDFAQRKGYRLGPAADPTTAQRLALQLRMEDTGSAIEAVICLAGEDGPGRRTKLFQLIFQGDGFDDTQAAIEKRLLRELSLWENAVIAQKRRKPAPA